MQVIIAFLIHHRPMAVYKLARFPINLHPENFNYMRYSNQAGAAAALLLIISCFLPWVYIEVKSITVSGFATAGTGFGKPGLLASVLAGVSILFYLIPRVWAKRANLFVTGLNMAWAIRNYIIVSACHDGECPQKQTALFLMLGASVAMIGFALFPRIDLKQESGSKT
jgi:hypothetical protein